MSKPSNNNGEADGFLLTHRAGYLKRLIVDMEAGRFELPDPSPRGPGGAVIVPSAVLDGILAVRDSGATNMLDRPAVLRLAALMGYNETALWIGCHPSDYSHGIFHGFIGTMPGEETDE